MRIAIVGAGMAGLACAERLAGAGVALTLFDKGRGPGGRMSTRRLPTPLGEVGLDHGCQYFTARDEAFRARVELWRDHGVAAPWLAAGPDAWVGIPGMSAPVKVMSQGFDVRWDARIDRIADEAGGWRIVGAGVNESGFDAVLVAVPSEQVAPLLAPFEPLMAERATAAVSDPCWTAMAVFDAPLPLGDIFRGKGVVAWAARNSAKPGRAGTETWVIHGSPDWSRTHLEKTPGKVADALLAAFFAEAEAQPKLPAALQGHRWRYARSGASGEGAMWDAGLGLGVCGDWLLGPRVECAWLSGDRLAQLVLNAAGEGG